MSVSTFIKDRIVIFLTTSLIIIFTLIMTTMIRIQLSFLMFIVLMNRQIVYFGSNKDRFQLQFPDSVCQRLGTMPKEFLLKSQRKGVKRFWTPFITEKFTLLQRVGNV